jgi:hypothetical protein
MGNLKSFDIKRLRPFRKSDNQMPRTVPDEEDKIARLDHDLQPDEQAYVRHYVNYADVMLDQKQPAASESGNNLVEMPRQNGEKSSPETQDNQDDHEAA